MASPRRLTIREIAQAAGVSTQTVSRVLNNRPDVAPETFARVERIIAETGYSPNVVARSLTQGRSHVIGVVAYGLEYVGPSRLLTGIDQQSAESGYSISLNLIHAPETHDVARLLNGLIARQVDGIIWAVPQVGSNRTWAAIPAAGPVFLVPVLLVGGMEGQAGLPSIAIDNQAIGRLATQHLLAGGARRIGLVTGLPNWWEAQQRELGWRSAVLGAGLAVDPGLVEAGDWTANSGQAALGALLEREPELDAVFASNDQMALGVLHAAHQLGRRVPEELAVVGVDDIAEASHFWPSLTTIHQPLREAGALAVREIDAAIDRARAGSMDFALEIGATVLQPELIVRDSTRGTG